MSIILAIESATKNCSVSLFENGKIIATKEEYNDSYSHAEKLTIFIEDVLSTSNFVPKDLDAVVVDKGPGSYTGLRIGVSVTKGLAYALNIPMLAINSLEILLGCVIEDYPDFDYYIPMIDARRMEVYCCVFDTHGHEVSPVISKIIDPDSFSEYKGKRILLFGDGASKCESVLLLEHIKYLKNINPSTIGMNIVAQKKYENKDFEDSAYFEPFYLKDFIAGKPKKLL